MTTFLAGQELKKQLQAMSAVRRIHCAVAFWGRGAEDCLRPQPGVDVRIICNLSSGSTNPDTVKQLMRSFGKDAVRQMADLHAKVYIVDSTMIVGSANASVNGLGFEGREQMGWEEAGCSSPVTEAAEQWFASCWERGKSITPGDLARARSLYRARRAVRASRISTLVPMTFL